MSYRVTIHSSAPIGHHGKVHIETFDHRADAEGYARAARKEDPGATTRVDGQHEEAAATLESARAWMAHIAAIWASAPQFTDHNHRNGRNSCPICSTH